MHYWTWNHVSDLITILGYPAVAWLFYNWGKREGVTLALKAMLSEEEESE